MADESYRQLLIGAIAGGFEEFRQRVLTAVQLLTRAPPAEKPMRAAEGSLAIGISASKSDHDLGVRVKGILLDPGTDVLTAPSEPAPNQTPTDFNAQLDEVIAGSEGVIIAYGQTAPAWVQARYVRARKALAQRRKGMWCALLDGPPAEKPDPGVASRNLMVLDCRDALRPREIARFVNALRAGAHA